MKNWLYFIALSFIWGSSFFFQKLALQEVGPVQTVAFRFLSAFALLQVVMRWQGQTLPREPRTWLTFFGLCFVYSIVPVFLASWATTRIDTGLGSILGATGPLFQILLTALVFRNESINGEKVLGTLIGFVGMIVIIGADALFNTRSNDLLGQLAVIGSSACNAISAILSHKMLKRFAPAVQSSMIMLWAGSIMAVATPVFETPRIPTLPSTWLGLIALGLFASCIANLLWFNLVKAWGPTRAGMISYAIPIVGISIGFLLGERMTWQLVVGSLLVLLGIAVVNGMLRLGTSAKTAK